MKRRSRAYRERVENAARARESKKKGEEAPDPDPTTTTEAAASPRTKPYPHSSTQPHPHTTPTPQVKKVTHGLLMKAAGSDGEGSAAIMDGMLREGDTGSRQPKDNIDSMSRLFDFWKKLNEEELIRSVKEGDEGWATVLLARGGDPKVTVPAATGGSWCLVALAAHRGYAHLLPCLLGAGLSVEGRGSDDRTPLMLAAWQGHTRTVQDLLTLGADPLAADKAGRTALLLAAMRGSAECVSALIPSSDLNAKDEDGHTPLHLAAKRGRAECVSALIPSSDLNAKNKDGHTPLLLAAMRGSAECVFALIPSSDLNAKDKDGRTPLHLAAMQGNAECVSALIPSSDLNAQDENGRTSLHLAAEEGHLKVVRRLTKKDVKALTIRDKRGRTPLDVATMSGNTKVEEWLEKRSGAVHLDAARCLHLMLPELIHSVKEGDEGRATVLLARGGDPKVTVPFNTRGSWCLVALAAHRGHAHLLPCLLRAGLSVEGRGSDDRTPLMLAAWQGHTRTVRDLLTLGADPLAADKAGRTALLLAAEWSSAECVSALIPSSDLNAKDKDGRTPLHLAAMRGSAECVSALIPSSDLNAKDKHGRTPLHLAAERSNAECVSALIPSSDLNAKDKDGRTPLHLAAERGSAECVSALIPSSDRNAKDEDGRTPLHLAAMRGSAECVSALKAFSDFNAQDENGRTPLHLAAEKGHLKVIQRLTEKDVTALTIRDKRGRTPLDVATMRGNTKVEEWLGKRSGAEHLDAARCLHLMRIRRHRDENNHRGIVSRMRFNFMTWLDCIPEHDDWHLMDADGLTPLHHAAHEGCPPRNVTLLLQAGGSPHMLTPDGLTPADLARRAGREETLAVLTQHVCGKSSASPEELHDQLLGLIIERDNVKEASRLLCKGAPIESVASGGNSPLRLAVILDRCRTTNLLLACGAMLPANLLQDAWQSPDVTSGVLAALTATYLCRLRAERGRVKALVKGIDALMKTIEGDTPWRAAWPEDEPQALSALMVEAVRARCPVSAAFLHRAGAWSFLSGEWGTSALATALEEGHTDMAELLVRHLGSSIYADVRLLSGAMPEAERRRLGQYQYQRELVMLEDLVIRQKSERGKEAARLALQLQEKLHDSHVAGRRYEGLPRAAGRSVLQLSVRKGLVQLTYLVVQVGRLPVDVTLDDICGTTALHEAASHGKDSCVALLLGVGADPLRRDRYDQTPRLLAAMFGHKSTEQLLALHEPRDPPCRAGTTAEQANHNYDAYLRRYEKLGSEKRESLTPIDRHYPERVTCRLMEAIGVQELWERAGDALVDFSRGEAREVKDAVMKELHSIIEKIAQEDSLYNGKLRLVGSSEDGSKIYCPDEMDVNLLITPKNVKVEVEETPKGLAPAKGKYKMSIVADAPGLQGNKLMDNLFLLLHKCLAKYTLQDERLSFVPPGLCSTQVGAALTLAWQGKEYPLLLVGVDLVPVLELPWHEKISKPKLIKDTAKTFHVSNTADGYWRCSFALTEATVLKKLSPIRRRVMVMGKVLLSCLKTEPWMPQHMKHLCTWFVDRAWKIIVPNGFCFKNAFLSWLQEQAEDQQVNSQEEARCCTEALIAIYRQLCDEPEVLRGHLRPGRISAYFGGDFEGVKQGEGAPLIVRCLEEQLEKE